MRSMEKDIMGIEDARAGGLGLRMTEREFLRALVRHEGKIVSAYREVFPDEAKQISPNTMLKRGKKILERKVVKEYMARTMRANEVSVEYVLGGIIDVADNAKKDVDRLKGYELLGRFLKMFGDGNNGSNNTFNINISEDTARRLLERRGRYEIGGRGDFIDVKDDKGGGRGDVINGEEIVD